MRTADELQAEGEELLTAAKHHMNVDRPDLAYGCAYLAQAHFAAAAAVCSIELSRRALAEAPVAAEPAPPTSDADLLRFLMSVRDCDVRTYAGEVSIYDKRSSASWAVSKEFARAAEQAGLVIEYASGRWGITGRGRETLDRGQV